MKEYKAELLTRYYKEVLEPAENETSRTRKNNMVYLLKVVQMELRDVIGCTYDIYEPSKSLRRCMEVLAEVGPNYSTEEVLTIIKEVNKYYTEYEGGK